MNTEALCPTCHHPFSFLKIAFAITPFRIFCNNCHSQILILNFRRYLWLMLVGIGVITAVLLNFVVSYDMRRLFVLVVLWIALYELLEVSIGLLIVNWGTFAGPPRTDGQVDQEIPSL